MPLELNTQEQSVLDSAASRHIDAMTKLQAAEREAQRLREEANGIGAQMQGTFRAVLALKGLNPDAYAGRWSEEDNKVVVESMPASPADATPLLSVVPEEVAAE